MARRPHGLAATGFVATVALAPAAFGAPGDALRIEAYNVNVRAGPSLDAEAVLQLDRGHRVVEVGRDGAWVGVELPDRGGWHGWIHGALVAPAAAEPEPAADRHRPPAEARGDDRREVVEVQVGSANIRTGPAMDSPVVAWMHGGRRLPVLERSNGWVRVGLAGGQVGWIHGTLVAPAGARDAQASPPVLRPGTGPVSAPALKTPEAPRSGASGRAIAAVVPEAEVRPAAEPTIAAPASAHPTAVEIETAPAPPQGRSGARLEIPATTVGPRERPDRPAPMVGRPERDGGPTEPERTEGRRAGVAVAGPDGGQGSVHEALAQPVAPATMMARAEATAALPAAAPSPEGKAPDGGGVIEARTEEAITNDGKLARFGTMVGRVNERVRRAVGVDVFAEVEDLGGGAVELTATDAWHAAPEAARRANLEALARSWATVHEPDAPIIVRIVNDRGEVMMEERRGGGPLPPLHARDGSPGGGRW